MYYLNILTSTKGALTNRMLLKRQMKNREHLTAKIVHFFQPEREKATTPNVATFQVDFQLDQLNAESNWLKIAATNFRSASLMA